MLRLARVQVPPMLLGHSFRLVPLAAEQLRQYSAEKFNQAYADMAFGRSPGFVCSNCGIELDDYCKALAIAVRSVHAEPHVHWTIKELLPFALHVPCEPRTAITGAALRGKTGTVLHDELRQEPEPKGYGAVRAVIGVALDLGITALGGAPPPLQRSY